MAMLRIMLRIDHAARHRHPDNSGTSMDIEDSINRAENALRDLVERLLLNEHGGGWFEKAGLTTDRISLLTERREEERKRRPGGEVEQRLLYYSDLNDVVQIISKNWDAGFKDSSLTRRGSRSTPTGSSRLGIRMLIRAPCFHSKNN